MFQEFNQDKLDTPQQHEVNTLILEQATDIAEKLTSLECRLADIKEYDGVMVNGIEEVSYTKEAQEIFNVHYDYQVMELYTLLKAQLKLIKKDLEN